MYKNIIPPKVLIASNHHIPLYIPPVALFIILVIPDINPAAIIPGSKGTNIFAIFCNNFCTGLIRLPFPLLLSLPAVSFSLEKPRGISVSLANSTPTAFTVPGPNIICNVSDSTTFMTPSIFFISDRSGFSLTVILNLVIQVAFATIFSLPPKALYISFAIFFPFIPLLLSFLLFLTSIGMFMNQSGYIVFIFCQFFFCRIFPYF